MYFNFRLKEEDNSPEQLFLLIKNIWFYKITISNPSINAKDFEHMSAEELNQQISSIESKISYLKVLIYVYFYLIFKRPSKEKINMNYIIRT